MRNRNGREQIIYTHMNQLDRYIVSSGIRFSEFMNGLPDRPSHLLLLNHRLDHYHFNMHTKFNFVTGDHVDELIRSTVSRAKNFCWIDFQNEEFLNELTDQELAELLYLSHMKHHLRPPFYRRLGNQFAYLSCDQDLFNKIYYRKWSQFYTMFGSVVAGRISPKRSRNLFARWKNRTIPPVPAEVMHSFHELLGEGVAFSLEEVTDDRQQIAIPLWVIGDFNDVDEMYDEYDLLSRQKPHGELIYDRKISEWGSNIYL